MGNIATTIEEQIQILKARGLIIKDENKAKRKLLDIGYYRLGFYSFYFQNKNHQFYENIDFQDLINLYYFDTNLKHLLLKFITRIEINFRTKLIYFASNEYPKNPTWFADPKIVDKKFVKKLPLFYNDKFKKNNKTIKLHHTNHKNDKYAPAWKTLEFFTFGSNLLIYKSLKKPKLKTKISLQYGIKSPKTFINFLDTIRFIRNISAHGGVLFDCHLSDEVKNTSLIPFKNEEKHAPYTAIRVIVYMMKKISKNHSNDAANDIKSLFEQYRNDSKISKIISDCVKYPW